MDSHVSYLNLVLNVSTLYSGHTTWLTTKTDLHCKRLWNEFPSFCEATVFTFCKYQQMPASSEEISTNKYVAISDVYNASDMRTIHTGCFYCCKTSTDNHLTHETLT